MNICKENNVEVIQRPSELCLDTSTTEEVISHSIPHIQRHLAQSLFGIVLLQPTSPLRTAKDIDEAVQLFQVSKCKALISVKTIESSILKAYIKNEQGFLTGAFSSEAPHQPRQQLPQVFMPNGAIYIFTNHIFQQEGEKIPRDQLIPFEMDDHKSIDIDTYDDLVAANNYLEKHDGKIP
jgi:CMP-N,N'-diacetyllegionaminic acid synthase